MGISNHRADPQIEFPAEFFPSYLPGPDRKYNRSWLPGIATSLRVSIWSQYPPSRQVKGAEFENRSKTKEALVI
jgi:hypothetical protein